MSFVFVWVCVFSNHLHFGTCLLIHNLLIFKFIHWHLSRCYELTVARNTGLRQGVAVWNILFHYSNLYLGSKAYHHYAGKRIVLMWYSTLLSLVMKSEPLDERHRLPLQLIFSTQKSINLDRIVELERYLETWNSVTFIQQWRNWSQVLRLAWDDTVC